MPLALGTRQERSCAHGTPRAARARAALQGPLGELAHLALAAPGRTAAAGGRAGFRQGRQGRLDVHRALGQGGDLPPARGRRRPRRPQGSDRGEHFGELALFDEKPRSASAEAKADCVLLELAREHFISDIVRSEASVLAILSEVAVRLRDTNALLSQRAARDVVKEFEEQLRWSDKLADRVAELNGSV